MSDRGDKSVIYVMNTDGSNLTRLTNTAPQFILVFLALAWTLARMIEPCVRVGNAQDRWKRPASRI